MIAPTRPIGWWLLSAWLFAAIFLLANRLLAEEQVGSRAAAPATGQWPVFRGNAAGTGVATTTLPDDLKLLWEFRADDSFFAATAAISDGTVYIGDADRRFYAIDLDTGRKRWSHDVELGFLGSAAVRDGRVLVGDSDGVVYCFDANSGQILWKQETGAEINSSPNFYKESILIGSQNGSLYRFRLRDGSIVWKYTIEASGGIQCSPTLAQNHAFVCGCDGKLHVIDIETGSTTETIDIGDPTLSTPAVLGDDVYFGTEGAKLFSVNWRERRIEWTYENPRRRISYRSSPAVTDRGVVIGGRNQLVEFIDRESGKCSWSFPTKGRIDSSPVIAGKRVFVGSNDGRLYGLDLENGNLVWSYDGGAGFTASPAVAAGRLVIGNDDGVLYCFGKKSPE
jgi:outer membrane protein assembly factor BamB